MPSGLQEDARHRPVFISATGQAVLPVPCSTKERAERLAKGRFRGRPLARRGSRTPFESQRHTGNGSAEASEDRVNRTGPRKQSFACVPHADGFIGLLDVPGFGACAPAPRSCELSPGHALGPSARVAGVCAPAAFKNRNPRRRLEPGIVADHRIPLPRHEHARGAPLYGAGCS